MTATRRAAALAIRVILMYVLIIAVVSGAVLIANGGIGVH